MKYIYNRGQYNNYNKINETIDMDSSKMKTPEFGETLIGGTLHRLLGFFRSKVNEVQMVKYSKTLDRLLASIVLKVVVETANGEHNSNTEENDNEDGNTNDNQNETIIRGIELTAASETILLGYETYINGDEEKAIEIMADLDVPDEVMSDLPVMAQESYDTFMTLVVDKEEQEEKQEEESTEEINAEEENVEEENNEEGNEEKSDGEDDTLHLSDGEIEKEKNDNSDNNDGERIDAIQKINKRIKSLINKLTEVKKLCINCKIHNDRKVMKITKLVETGLEQVKSTLSDGDKIDNLPNLLNEIEQRIGWIEKKCGSCKTGDKVDEALLDKMYYNLMRINEINSNRTESTKNLTQKGFNALRKEIEKASKDWKISKEELREIDKVANERNVVVREEDITDREGKELMAILSKAKNAMLHTKPYDEIRKNQKRWYDKLKDSERSLNRKAYQTWTKKVLEVVAYYKRQMPKKVNVLITDSLDKSHIADDYVRLTQEFLGINKRGKKPSDNYGNSGRNNNNDSVTGYVVGDTVTYNRASGTGTGKGKVTEIKEKSVKIETVKSKRDNKPDIEILKHRIIGIGDDDDGETPNTRRR